LILPEASSGAPEDVAVDPDAVGGDRPVNEVVFKVTGEP
jgi:hypothetical protein